MGKSWSGMLRKVHDGEKAEGAHRNRGVAWLDLAGPRDRGGHRPADGGRARLARRRQHDGGLRPLHGVWLQHRRRWPQALIGGGHQIASRPAPWTAGPVPLLCEVKSRSWWAGFSSTTGPRRSATGRGGRARLARRRQHDGGLRPLRGAWLQHRRRWLRILIGGGHQIASRPAPWTGGVVAFSHGVKLR